jgi:hypothetical protein
MGDPKSFVRFDREDTVVVFLLRPLVAFIFWTLFLVLFSGWGVHMIFGFMGSYCCGVLSCYGGFRSFVIKKNEDKKSEENADE